MSTRVWAEGGVRLGVDVMALACCTVEAVAGLESPGFAAAPDGPVDAHVLVVAGTVTLAALPTVVARFEALPEPRRVVAFGACATSGGPYWDSPVVVPGIGGTLPVDLVVPGCPPRPHLLADALRELAAGVGS